LDQDERRRQGRDCFSARRQPHCSEPEPSDAAHGGLNRQLVGSRGGSYFSRTRGASKASDQLQQAGQELRAVIVGRSVFARQW
jgi:hypothetical protein